MPKMPVTHSLIRTFSKGCMCFYTGTEEPAARRPLKGRKTKPGDSSGTPDLPNVSRAFTFVSQRHGVCVHEDNGFVRRAATFGLALLIHLKHSHAAFPHEQAEDIPGP